MKNLKEVTAQELLNTDTMYSEYEWNKKIKSILNKDAEAKFFILKGNEEVPYDRYFFIHKSNDIYFFKVLSCGGTFNNNDYKESVLIQSENTFELKKIKNVERNDINNYKGKLLAFL